MKQVPKDLSYSTVRAGAGCSCASCHRVIPVGARAVESGGELLCSSNCRVIRNAQLDVSLPCAVSPNVKLLEARS